MKLPYLPGTTTPNQRSSGFGAYVFGNGARYLTTAWHCFNPNDGRAWTWQSHLIGNVSAANPDNDTVFIKSSAGNSTDHWIFDGGHPNNYQRKQVVATQGYRNGDYVCASGSVTEAICGVRMKPGSAWIVENPYTGTEAGVEGYSIESVGKTIVAANGDSGGPVFSNTTNNTQAIARGMISAAPGVGGQVTCPQYVTDHNAPFSSVCFYLVFVVNAATLASEHNVSFSY